MLAQRRFAGHFTFVPRKDWSAETVSLEEWILRSSEEKVDTCVFVEQPRNDGTISRFVLDESVLRFTEAVASAWNALQRSASRAEPAREDRVATETPEGAPVASQPEPAPDETNDAFATLSDRLFSLSGFRDANLTLAEWPPPSDSNGTEGSEST
jgi:hypothetical protein